MKIPYAVIGFFISIHSIHAQTIRIDWNKEHQTMHSFGASDCWSAKFIGNWKDEQKKEQVADWLFSMDTLSDGSPKGIGLSLWRFNIGAGSYEQGAASNIPDEWRREECFIDAKGNYDFSKQKGQQWFLNAARQRGVQYTLGFSIAPPVFWAKNGKAYNGTAEPAMNIQPARMQQYADFMVKVTGHFRFDYLSPVNEPQWNWGKDRITQEGTQATNDEIAGLVRRLSKGLKSKASVVIGEAGQWNFLYSKNEENRGDQVRQFFNSSSRNYIGNLPNVSRVISSHSYFTTCPDDSMVEVRKQVAAAVKEVDPALQTWQTEFGILGNICNVYNGGPRHTGIDYGLYVAKVIHHDITIANTASWQWWLAMSPYNYSDALVYINDVHGKIKPANCKQDGRVLDSKQLWALGNYARFVRPGMKRIAVEGVELVSAYKDEVTKTLVVVIINPGSNEKQLQLDMAVDGGMMNAYTTSSTLNCKRSVVQVQHIVVPPQSIITLTGRIVQHP
jgi:hypothetical protein